MAQRPRPWLATILVVVALCLLGAGLAGAAGEPDVFFDQAGVVVTGFETAGSGTFSDSASDVLLQGDGRIVAVGTKSTAGAGSRVTLVRVGPSGSLDQTFGNWGRLEPTLRPDMESSARGIVRQSGGKLVLTGRFEVDGDSRIGAFRLNGDGSKDSTFAVDGGRLTSIPSLAGETSEGIALQPDGKIVVAGHGCIQPCTGTPERIFVVARYTADGGRDSSFGPTGGIGVVLTNFASSGHEQAFDVAVHTDGKIVLAGSATVGGSRQIALARYRTDGTLDTGFDGDGKVLTDFTSSIGEEAFAVAIQPNGRVVVAGTANLGTVAAPLNHVALVRYRTNGTLDPTFSGDGKVVTDFAGDDAEATSIAIQRDGKIVVAGRAKSGSRTRAVLVRYNANGSLDTSFDDDGRVLVQVPASTTAVANAVALQPDGMIVTAGSALVSGRGTQYLLARHQG
jgi:uncharacterized delta-60 repeat protein